MIELLLPRFSNIKSTFSRDFKDLAAHAIILKQWMGEEAAKVKWEYHIDLSEVELCQWCASICISRKDCHSCAFIQCQNH